MIFDICVHPWRIWIPAASAPGCCPQYCIFTYIEKKNKWSEEKKIHRKNHTRKILLSWGLPLTLQTRGPPLSPWQVSTPPFTYPAQNMLEVNAFGYRLWHVLLLIIGTSAYFIMFGEPDSYNIMLKGHKRWISIYQLSYIRKANIFGSHTCNWSISGCSCMNSKVNQLFLCNLSFKNFHLKK